MGTDVIVAGAGAAGLLCAAEAARRGRRVLLLEKMERPGRKLLITGKGRCNLTNNCSRDGFLAAVRTNSRFLYSAYSAFSAQDTMALWEALGVPLKTERGGRVFPVSDRSADVVDALVRHARESGARLEQGKVTGLLLTEAGVAGVRTDRGDIPARSVVVATGGLSYPRTGSTGDGYRLAAQAGHTVVPRRPSLIPVETEESWCRDLMGLSLKNCILTVRRAGAKKPVFSELGEMLFTHFGVSGPLVLSASAHMAGDPGDYRMEIDLKPGLTEQQLDARLLRDFGENRNRDFSNALGELLPRKLIPVAVSLSGIGGGTKVHQITRERRRELAGLLKGLPLTPKAFRPIEEAVVTAGGVAVEEVSPKTMESKRAPGLYFAGEVLDVDAYTGGYNLQIAFSTGFLAAQHV